MELDIKSQFENILLDLDGTLIDPIIGITSAIRFALNCMNVPCPSMEILTSCIGPPLRKSFPKLLASDDTELVEKAVSHYREYFSKTGLHENSLYPGVNDGLTLLASRFNLYLATAKPTVYAKDIVKHHRLNHLFKGIYGSELDGTYDNKADLIRYLVVSEQISPQKSLMVGDREGDIESAHSNSMKAAGASWGYGSALELEKADYLLSSFSDLVLLVS